MRPATHEPDARARKEGNVLHRQRVQLGIPGAPSGTNTIESTLRNAVAGEVRFDPLARTIYATDASIYEITPRGVVFPKSVDDVVAAVRACRAHRVSLVARGAGTGLAGGAVGPGVQLDLSRHLNRVGPVNVERRTVEVEPGVVLDELNAHLAPHGLTFAPDVATASRATIGGMIANNSCGARSIRYGRTVDHIDAVRMVLADGTVAAFAEGNAADDRAANVDAGAPRVSTGSRAAKIERELARIRDRYHDEIARRFPKILRSNGGYGLDRLGPPGTRASAVKLVCGSEGTLGVIVSATLKLVPVPREAGLVVLHFDDLLSSLRVVPDILKHNPSTVELIDKLIMDAGRASPALADRCGFLEGDPQALLVVEFHGDSVDAVTQRIEALTTDSVVRAAACSIQAIRHPRDQADVWSLRTSGLGLLMSQPGDEQPYSFIEDTAVDPARLAAYIERVMGILDREGVHAGYYAHASVGCIHVKPALNLKTSSNVEKMRRIAEAVCALAVEFGGTMSGEHGDGLVRSCWLEKLYGPRIIEAFREVKRLFDPDGIMNPGKIVDALPMTEHLRFGPSLTAHPAKTYLDFSAHGGMAGLASMCSGVGQCRQRLVGTMCPSFMATGDETHTTRARANALRVALSNRGLLRGLADPQLDEVMDLCLSCKACKTECPTGVDMARLKAEFLSHRNLTRGVGRRARLIAETPEWLARASRLPRMANLIGQSSIARRWVERRYGLDRRIPPPRLASRTFRAWFRRHERRRDRTRRAPLGWVIYFVDTWTNFITPTVGAAAVRLLEHAGFDVRCPRAYCCGRPALSQGLLTEAKQLAAFNVRVLTDATPGHTPIVGTEPSCLLTLTDEYPQLLRAPASRDIASRCFMIETLLARVLRDNPNALRFRTAAPRPLLYHGHCHQKALVGTNDAMALLNMACGNRVTELDSGCCGMAGAFGHEVEHYDVARAVGEDRLFPAVRARGEAAVVISGFSCRCQIAHYTDARPRHVVEYLADALEP